MNDRNITKMLYTNNNLQYNTIVNTYLYDLKTCDQLIISQEQNKLKKHFKSANKLFLSILNNF